MNRIKAPSYIMKYSELRLKVLERKMNTSLDDEGTIANNEGMKWIILGFFYKRLLILFVDHAQSRISPYTALTAPIMRSTRDCIVNIST